MSAASSASTTRSSAAFSPAAGACRSRSPRSSSAITPRTPSDEVAFVRLADMLAHYAQGGAVSPTELLRCARSIGLGPEELRSVMYDLPFPSTGRARQVDPCPLSGREVEVLKRLSEGKVYKQIAHELELSTSTVRTHLHNIYGKLGAVDRAQAVLSPPSAAGCSRERPPSRRRRAPSGGRSSRRSRSRRRPCRSARRAARRGVRGPSSGGVRR